MIARAVITPSRTERTHCCEPCIMYLANGDDVCRQTALDVSEPIGVSSGNAMHDGSLSFALQ